jgi:hypothetical protein
MRLVRVVVPRTSSIDLCEIGDHSIPLFQCSDGDTAIVLASWRDRLMGQVGTWLEVGPGYSAQIAARDVRTLSVLADLRHVVISAPDRARDHADVVRALLTGEEVNLSNDVATLRHAFSRPAPPQPVTVWSYQDEQLVSPGVTLRVGQRDVTNGAVLTYFEGYSG